MFCWSDCTIPHLKVAAHPQMDQQAVVFELDVEKFRPAPYIQYPLTLDVLFELLGRRNSQGAIPAQVSYENLFTDQGGLQLACECFDFR